jgi:hypothetical protein
VKNKTWEAAMPDHPQAERELFRDALKPAKDCLSVESLEGLLGENPPEELVLHVSHCAHCQTELELLRSFHLNEIASGDVDAVRAIEQRLHHGSPRIFARAKAEPWWQQFFNAPRLGPAALSLATLLVAIGLGIQWRQNVVPPLNSAIGGGHEVFRSSTITVLAPTGDIAEAPSDVRWEAVPNAARYRVRLLEVDRTELWSDDVADTRAAIPPAARARVVPAKTLLWEVSAFDAEGRRVAQSEAVRFRFSQNVYKP